MCVKKSPQCTRTFVTSTFWGHLRNWVEGLELMSLREKKECTLWGPDFCPHNYDSPQSAGVFSYFCPHKVGYVSTFKGGYMPVWLQYIYFIYTATIDTPLLASSLDAGVRGHPGVKENTDHKPQNALPGGSVSKRLLENALCIKTAVGIALLSLSFVWFLARFYALYKNVLYHHPMRAICQALIWKQAISSIIDLPSFQDAGQKIIDKKFENVWMNPNCP